MVDAIRGRPIHRPPIRRTAGSFSQTQRTEPRARAATGPLTGVSSGTSSERYDGTLMIRRKRSGVTKCTSKSFEILCCGSSATRREPRLCRIGVSDPEAATIPSRPPSGHPLQAGNKARRRAPRPMTGGKGLTGSRASRNPLAPRGIPEQIEAPPRPRAAPLCAVRQLGPR